MGNFKIIGCGSYLPQKIVTNDDLSKSLDTTDEWIFSRSGIRARHIAAEDEYTSTLAANSLQAALEDCNLKANDLDAIIVATTTPDRIFPATATQVQKLIGMNKGFAFDIQAVCSGFIYGLKIADGLLNDPSINRIAIIGSETMSRIVDWQDRSTCVLFGDGAGAIIIERTKQKLGLLAGKIYSDGNLNNILNVPGGVSTGNMDAKLFMNGREVFKHGVEKMIESLKEVIKQADIDVNELDLLVPHQANIRMLNLVAENVGIDVSKVIITLENQGNTSAATIPLALCYAKKTRGIDNKLIALTAAGAGFTWGSLLIKN